MRAEITPVVVALLMPVAMAAQGAVPLTRDAEARNRPGGNVVASLPAGVLFRTGNAVGSETPVTIEGWVDGARLGARRDSFPASVSGRLTLRVRAEPNAQAPILAVLQPGTGVHTIGQRGTWRQVRRMLWVPTAAVSAARTPATTPTAQAAPAAKTEAPRQAPASPASTAPAAAPGAAQSSPNANGIIASTGTRLRDLPVGKVVGGLSGGTSVEIIGRQFGWVRVRAEGWVPDRELLVGDVVAAANLTASDIRSDPQGFRGRVVQWEVEVMALQLADPLRSDLARDEPYLLARGPGDENAVLYLAVPGRLLPDARAIAPMTKVTVTARVRNGRSQPAGTPILDLLSIVAR
ncbi:MAG: SH3 domain-containing protein [Gemmatimonadetes bacterium]|nr:SH3 domain-containing protein [Gemmatimonadota bacterium]